MYCCGIQTVLVPLSFPVRDRGSSVVRTLMLPMFSSQGFRLIFSSCYSNPKTLGDQAVHSKQCFLPLKVCFTATLKVESAYSAVLFKFHLSRFISLLLTPGSWLLFRVQTVSISDQILILSMD